MLEEVEEPELSAGSGGPVDKDPFSFFFGAGGGRTGIDGATVLVDGVGAEVGWFYDLADKMGFSDPGALLMRKNDRDGMPCVLKRLYE